MMPIRRKALYLEVIDFFMERIAQGKYAPGSRLPSEEELAREFGVSRVTLREALRVLAEDGVIIRSHGSGTYIREQKAMPIQDLSTILSISTMFKRAGLEQQVVRADYRRIPASQRVGEKLQLKSDEETWEIERIRAIGGKPVLYSLDYFPVGLVPPGGEEKIKEYLFATYYFLSEVCGQKIDQGRCNLKPLLADEKLQEIMKLPRNTPIMYIETVDLNPEQRPISYAREYYGADFFEFQVNRRRGGSDL